MRVDICEREDEGTTDALLAAPPLTALSRPSATLFTPPRIASIPLAEQAAFGWLPGPARLSHPAATVANGAAVRLFCPPVMLELTPVVWFADPPAMVAYWPGRF